MTTTPTPADLDTLRAEVASLRAAQRRAERRARLSFALAFAAVGLTLLLNVRPPALAQTPGTSLAGLLARLSALEQKTAPLTVTGTPGTFPATLTISGVNVHIVSGSGRTDDGTQGETPGAKLTGLGNLILGYDQSGVGGGSHNLVLGDDNSYSSFGGLVAGVENRISGPYASVTGGGGNTASDYYASVSGGVGNTASGVGASVSGGLDVPQGAPYGWAGGSYHSP